MVSEGPDRLAVDDDALLEQLQLRQLLVLPGEPEPEVVVDVGGLVDAALKTRPRFEKSPNEESTN